MINSCDNYLDIYRSAIRSTSAREMTTEDYERLRQLAFGVAELGERAVDPLCEALGDPDDRVRHYACIALTRAPSVEARVKALVEAASRIPLGPVETTTEGVVAFGESALDPLMRALESDNPNVRGRVADAIAGLGPGVVERLIGALGEPNPLVRREIAFALAEIGDLRAAPHLVALLSDEDEEVRWAAAFGFRYLHDPAAVQPLKTALEARGNSFAVKSAVAGSLFELGWAPENKNQEILIAVLDLDLRHGGGSTRDRISSVTRHGAEAVDHLVMALETADFRVPENAAIALRIIGDSRALAPLQRALSHQNYEVREAAGAALIELGPEGIRCVTMALEAEDHSASYSAATVLEKATTTLKKVGDAQAVQPLIEALNHEEPGVRRLAVFALADLAPLRAAQGLVQALSDPHPDVLDAAGRVLERFGETDLSRAVVDPLIEMLKNDRAVVRVRAVQALWKIGDGRATAPLAEIALKDPERGIRRIAAIALGAIGGEHAVLSLRAAADDEDPDVRREAVNALKKLGRP